MIFLKCVINFDLRETSASHFHNFSLSFPPCSSKHIVSVLGRDEGYTVKYNHLPHWSAGPSNSPTLYSTVYHCRALHMTVHP